MIGPARIEAQKQRDEQVCEQIRDLCGIALTNRSTIPAMFTASIGVASCGDRFKDDVERKAVLDVLVLCEKESSWPTMEAQLNLRRSWGWKT